MGKRFFTLLVAALAVLVVAVVAVALPPENTALPSIDDTTPTVGQTLNGSDGAWTVDPAETGRTREWIRCDPGCSTVVGSGSSYVVQEADIGNTLVFRVTVTNDDGSTPADSTPTAAVAGTPPTPPGGGIPSPTGTPTVGAVLDGHTGAWGGVPAPSFAYQWIRCDAGGGACADIAGAVAWQYTLTADDAGKTIKVRVTGTNPYGSAAGESPLVGPITQAPANQAPPVVAAPDLNVSQTATVTPGTWVGPPEPTVTDNWQRCDAADGSGCVDVGAAGPAYVLQLDDAGKWVRVRETATNTILPDGEVASNLVGQVTLAPQNTGADGMVLPSITDGNDEVPMRGETLTGSSGIWFGFPPPAFLHQWQRCNDLLCVNIGTPLEVPSTPVDGGPHYAHTGVSQYVLTDDDLGFTIQLVVTAANGVGSPVVLASGPTLPVHGGPVNRTDLAGGAATLSGIAARGQTLTVTSGLWTGFWVGPAPLSITHEWFRVTPDGDVSLGAVETPLSPAAAATCGTSATPPAQPCSSASVYTLGEADLGSRIRVVVTVANAGGTLQLELLSDVVLGAPIVARGPDGVAADPDALPRIIGVPGAGLFLAASPGSWSAFPADTLAFTYQWLRCSGTTIGSCSAIPGATEDAYKLGSADVGSRVRVRVTASNGVLPDGVAESEPTTTVASGGSGGVGGGAGPDLLVQLSSATAGGEVTFTATVRNFGSSAAGSATFTGALAPGLALQSATASQGSCAGAVSCSLGSLPVGGTATVKVVARAAATGSYRFTASVDTAGDVNPSNNSLGVGVFLTVSSRAPTGSAGTRVSGASGAGKGSAAAGKVKKVVPKLEARRVKKTWVVDTTFSLLSGAAKLQVIVTQDGSMEPLAFLAGSRLGPTKVGRKGGKLLTLNAKKRGTFPIRLVLPAKGFALAKSYVIRITATAASGASATLDLGFRGVKLLKRSTKVRFDGKRFRVITAVVVPRDKAKVPVRAWVTKGTSLRRQQLLAGSRLGPAVRRKAGALLAVKTAKRGKLPVRVLLPVRGLVPGALYVLHVDTRARNAAWTTTEVRFKVTKAAVRKAIRAVASAKR